MSRRLHPAIRKLRNPWIVAAVLLAAAGLYILFVALGPALPVGSTPGAVTKKIQQAQIKENRLYIPKIGVDIAIVEGESEAALEKGAWHRKPANGNPEAGGNFVLSAHRFQIGFTPQQSHARSPFYRIDKLQTGDKLHVDYNKKRYLYEITRKYKVSRYAIAIEEPSAKAKLTLYSCDLRGEAAGREVIEAKPLHDGAPEV